MTQASNRYVNPKPFTADDDEAVSQTNPPSFFARLRARRLAFAAFVFLCVSYAMLPFVEVVAPYGSEARDSERIYAPPQSVRVFHNGAFLGPYVYSYSSTVNLETFKREFTLDTTKPQQIRFFCSGETYALFGVIPASLRLACPAPGGTLYLLGTDRLGRDILSRMLYGGRVSLTIGLIGVAISLALGILFGLLAGYMGGWIDNVIQRLIELLRSLPELPLWMALAAALPVSWSPLWVFVGITVILGLLDWPGLARAVRSRVLSLREEEFTVAAQLMGASPWRIMSRHMLPNFSSHIIASATLAIPGMILGETALSFLGLGLRAPVTSWGVMLNDAQNLAAIEVYPWLLAPLLPVIAVVLAFNLLGDGLRDAADPYSR
jgi:peptide/nickel transport system permease protein